MTSLFRKLNTLVKAKIHDALELPDLTSAIPGLDRRVEADARRMREKINDAIAYEDELQAKVDALRTEVERLDTEADRAVNEQREDRARVLIKSLTEAKRRLDFAEADLREHRLVAEELIRQVNLMESAIADARREEEPALPATPDASETSTSLSQPLERISKVLSQAQASMDRLRNKTASANEIKTSDHAIEDAVESAQVEDDLAARRQRRSGAPPKQ